MKDELFDNLIFHFLEIIWTLQILDNFSSIDIDFQNFRIKVFFYFPNC